MSQELRDAATEAVAAVKKLAELAMSEAAENVEPIVKDAGAKVREIADEIEGLVQQVKQKNP